MTEHDENCPSEGFYNVAQPNWRFSLWDVAAISVSTLGAVIGTVGHLGVVIHQGANMLAREFGAAANFARQTAELEEAQRLNEAARRQMSEGLERLISGPQDGDLS